MKLREEEREALKVVTLAAVATATSLGLALHKRRLFPTLLALGSACCAVGAISYLDGAYRVAEATEVAESMEELLDEAECKEAEGYLDAVTEDLDD